MSALAAYGDYALSDEPASDRLVTSVELVDGLIEILEFESADH
jgi:hypothetical protein